MALITHGRVREHVRFGSSSSTKTSIARTGGRLANMSYAAMISFRLSSRVTVPWNEKILACPYRLDGHGGRPVSVDATAPARDEAYSPEAPGSFLNDCSTASRNNIGSRSPPLANSIMRLATMLTAGSVRSIKPKECKVSSNAKVITATSSGENAPSAKRERIGIPQPVSANRGVFYHI
jgi:hypothetical protein